MYKLLEELEALIERWENTPYTGDYAAAAKAVCATELRKVIGQSDKEQRIWLQDSSSNDAKLQKGYIEST